VPIFTGNNSAIGDHLQGLTDGEGAPAYEPQGIWFRVFAVNSPERAPLFRCRIDSNGHHFLSTDGNCEGGIVEGPIGFVSTTMGAGLVALIRCRASVDHVSMLDRGGCNAAGYDVESVQGYATP
jgi:hypothetical protein